MRVGTTRYLLVSEEHVFQGIGSGHVELDKRFHHERPVRSGRGVDPPGVRPGRDGKSPTEAGVEGASSGRALPVGSSLFCQGRSESRWAVTEVAVVG